MCRHVANGRGEVEGRGAEKIAQEEEKCDLCVTCEKLPEDLKKVMRAWGGLSADERKRILEITDRQ